MSKLHNGWVVEESFYGQLTIGQLMRHPLASKLWPRIVDEARVQAGNKGAHENGEENGKFAAVNHPTKAANGGDRIMLENGIPNNKK